MRADLFNLGPYFNQYASQIMKGVMPTKQFKANDSEQIYRQSLLLTYFVKDFNALFDSVNLIEQMKGSMMVKSKAAS